MKVKFKIDEKKVIAKLSDAYGIRAEALRFIPVGDAAYSYFLLCHEGLRYYVKLFDHYNDRQKRGADKLSYYLPLLGRLHDEGQFEQLTWPIRALSGAYWITIEDCTLVLFNYIAGETLADAYPFSPEIVGNIAQLAAQVHRMTPILDRELMALPSETFDVSFLPDLEKCLAQLECQDEDADGDPILMELQAAMLPQKTQISEMVDLLHGLRAKSLDDDREKVLCHGDMWGGNLIRCENGSLALIDWESVMIAPIEFDLRGYIGEEFGIYLSAYEKELGREVLINTDVLRFYCYQHHLRNLTNWLLNLLVRDINPEQRANDLEMILYHCMNRWDSIEPQVYAVEMQLQDRK
ncbi:aminoglycoside phosphotransferase family protein [Paenibacillus sp. OV219]|uniref:aminoglycoside phosphotransferase family protein n=1 Tax=Paenibacillus sp. OV219 TaxID=1884377 RepID=UPI0008BD5ABC|nr:aminoglycoside phosphotransferase family protein [Paenibacillus sp. OV219]SEO98296.1 Phosphotransferase enzyme family protein [Paenibacillus sp. OV219]